MRKKLQESITRGKETHIAIKPGSKKAKNIDDNAARQAKKQQRVADNYKKGMNNAKANKFKKGNK